MTRDQQPINRHPLLLLIAAYLLRNHKSSHIKRISHWWPGNGATIGKIGSFIAQKTVTVENPHGNLEIINYMNVTGNRMRPVSN